MISQFSYVPICEDILLTLKIKGQCSIPDSSVAIHYDCAQQLSGITKAGHITTGLNKTGSGTQKSQNYFPIAFLQIMQTPIFQ